MAIGGLCLYISGVFKNGRDPGMLMKRRKETSRGGKLEIFKTVKLSIESNYRWVSEP